VIFLFKDKDFSGFWAKNKGLFIKVITKGLYIIFGRDILAVSLKRV